MTWLGKEMRTEESTAMPYIAEAEPGSTKEMDRDTVDRKVPIVKMEPKTDDMADSDGIESEKVVPKIGCCPDPLGFRKL